jgi:TatD DNase family protein
MIINTHSHLYSSEFDTCRFDVINRAKRIGIQKILLPDIDSLHRYKMMEVSNEFADICVPMIGIHPTSINSNYKSEIELLEKDLRTYDFCAIGEIGIDLYWDTTYTNQQIEAFEYQLFMAQKLHKPVAIHVRNSWQQVLHSIHKFPDVIGVFHCFSGNIQQAYSVIDNGFKLGIGGVVTYKNSGVDTVVEAIDLQHMVVETDDPWLAPVPYRGKVNEPSYISYIIQKIAVIKNCKIELVEEITSSNALQIFSL